MTYDAYHGPVRRIGKGRAVIEMLESERFRVDCSKCNKSFVHDRNRLRLFPQGLPISHFEETMPPKCWGMWDSQPANCPREVTWLDASDEDVGCSDAG